MERNARALSILSLLLATSGCIVDLGKLGEDTDGSEDDGASGMVDPTGDASSTSDGGSDGDSDDGPVMPLPTEREVDILFVIDNSGSMGEEQAKLANAVDALATVLDSAAIPVDYRIAVTTTDSGNPWCGTTGPEAGALRLSSCRSRPEEFTFNGAVVVEAFDEACAAHCPEGMDAIATSDGKPWIDVQHSTGQSNVAAVGDTLRCALPQGIDGCGFESQLESTYKALARFEDPSEPSFGFHRPGALLAVVLVSDESDCSSNPAWDDIFLPEGNRVFWSDDTAASPTSAVCWHAGMSCQSDGAGGMDCSAADFDVDGNATLDPDAAVLYPVDRYTEALVAAGVYVGGLYGVGLDGGVVYQEDLADPQWQNDFGIAAGCESPSGRAVPPGRMNEVVSALGGVGASICADGYEAALTAFGQGILARLP